MHDHACRLSCQEVLGAWGKRKIWGICITQFNIIHTTHTHTHIHPTNTHPPNNTYILTYICMYKYAGPMIRTYIRKYSHLALIICVCVCVCVCVCDGNLNAKQKHPGCKKSARPIRSCIANRYVRPKTLISVEVKKLLIKNLFNYLNDIQ